MLFPLFSAVGKNVGGNFLWANCLPIYLKVALIAEKWPPDFVDYFDLDFELFLCVVIPFAYISDSRKKRGEREAISPS